jgi:hypothetical protein
VYERPPRLRIWGSEVRILPGASKAPGMTAKSALAPKAGKSEINDLAPPWRHALALLAASPDGLTDSLLVYAHGIAIEVLAELIERGLAKVRVEKLVRPAVEVAHVEITDAGREAISVLQS